MDITGWNAKSCYHFCNMHGGSWWHTAPIECGWAQFDKECPKCKGEVQEESKTLEVVNEKH